MSELLWVLGVPVRLEVAGEFTRASGFEWVRQMAFPNFPSASLDALLELSDESSRVFMQLDQMCKKMEMDMAELADERFTTSINSQTPAQYLQGFQWAESDFSLQRGSLHDIMEEIQRSAHLAERGFREAYTKLTAARNAYNNAKKATDGPLQTRSLANLIYSESDAWFESENMTTVVCVVPRHMYDIFMHNYYTYCEYIVPGSAFKVSEDDSGSLITLIAMKEHLPDVTASLRREKVTVRDFTPQPKAQVENGSNASGALKAQLDSALTDLSDTASDVYPAVFKALCYLTVIRAYIESTLKFGLRDADGKNKGQLIITKVLDRSEKLAKQSVEQRILRKLYLSETKILGRDAKVYDSMDSSDSFLPFVYIPLLLDSGQPPKQANKQTGKQKGK